MSTHNVCFHRIRKIIADGEQLTYPPAKPSDVCDKNFTEEKEKSVNKGNDKHEDADSLLHNTSHTYCTKFQNPR